MQKRSLTLMKKVDSNMESILTQFLKIIELSSILDKSEGTLAVESLQIESNSSTIIRMVEELLSITRDLKESWILGQIPSGEVREEFYLDGLDEKMNSLLLLVLGDDDEVAKEGDVTYGDEEDVKVKVNKAEDKVKEEERIEDQGEVKINDKVKIKQEEEEKDEETKGKEEDIDMAE